MANCTRTWIIASACFSTALVGCALPSGGDGEKVAAQSEAENLAADFKIGLENVKYPCDTCGAIVGPAVQTDSVSGTAVSPFGFEFSQLTTLPSGLTDPTGARISLTNVGHTPDWLQGVDFQIGIQATDDGSAYEYGSIMTTPWASEGGGCSDFAQDGVDQVAPDNYTLFVATRNWPNLARVNTIQVGLQACGNTFDGPFNEGCNQVGSVLYTPLLSSIRSGSTAWTHTAGIPSGNPIDGLRVCLAVQ
jgi:hypothetical protein